MREKKRTSWGATLKNKRIIDIGIIRMQIEAIGKPRKRYTISFQIWSNTAPPRSLIIEMKTTIKRRIAAIDNRIAAKAINQTL